MLSISTEILPVIDAHTHVFPDKIADKARNSVSEFYHLPMFTSGSFDNLKKLRERDFNRACPDRIIVGQLISSPACDPTQTSHINDFIINLCKNDSCLVGFGTLHPDNINIDEELFKIKSNGLKGIKFHFDFQNTAIDDPEMYPIYRKISELELPMLFHMGDKKLNFSSPQRLADLLKDIPDLKIIAAHMGGYSSWEEAYNILPADYGLYFDISSTLAFIEPYELKMMIDKFGIDKFFFGSDFPMWNPYDELARLRKCGLTNDYLRKIEFENFKTYFR